MKNIVSVVYDKTAVFPLIKINGEQLGRYSTLTNYIYDDPWNWVDMFFECMDDELGEPYVVELIGHPFHQKIFSYGKEKSSYCEDVQFEKLEMKIPYKEKFSAVLEANASFPAFQAPNNECVSFDASKAAIESLYGYDDVIFTDENSLYQLCAEHENYDLSHKLIVILSDRFLIEPSRKSMIIELRQEDFQTLVDYLNIYQLRLKFIFEYMSRLNKLQMPKEKKIELESLVEERISIVCQNPPEKVEIGQLAPIKYHVFPAELAENERIQVKSDSPDIVETNDSEVVGVKEGTTRIRFLDSKEKELFSFPITCVKTNRVQNITIIIPATYLRVGDTFKFDTVFTPMDAEDIKDATVTVSDEKVAILKSKDTLYGIAAGRVCVTVATKHVSRKFYVFVAPKPLGLYVEKDNFTFYANTIATFGATYFPANAMPVPEVSWTSSNPRVVRIESGEGFVVSLKTLARGKATLTCKNADGTLKKDVFITVK